MFKPDYSSDESSADLNEDEAGQRRKRRSTENDFLNPAADQLNGEDYDYDDYEDHEYFEGDEYDEYGEHLDYEYIASEKVALLMAEEDKRYLSTLGHQFEDMVLSCTFRGIPCRYNTPFKTHASFKDVVNHIFQITVFLLQTVFPIAFA